MNSKPSLEKVQESTSLSTKRFLFKSQVKHDILDKKTFNQQIIKRKKAFAWKCKTGQGVLGLIDSEFLARVTKSDRRMQKFQVFLYEYFQRSNKGLNCLAQALKQLPYLKSLSLFFRVRTNESFYQISKEIGNLIHLQTLRLSFDGDESFTDETLSLFTQVIRKLPLIEEFDLGFRCMEITDAGLRDISKCIKSLHRLRMLAISFRSSKITVAGLYEIQKGLKGLVRLENLRIYLDYFSMTDTGIQHIIQGLKGLPQMRSIQLECPSDREITDTSFLILGENLKELRNLQNIDLNFYRCLVTDKGIDDFSKNLKQLGSLERLSLKFWDNNQTTDKGLELLGLNLGEVVSLKQVFLQFRNYYSQAGRNKFFKSMKEHVKVKFDGDAARPIEKQEKRNNFFFVIPIIFGLIGWFLAQIKSILLGESFSWMVFVYLAMSLLVFFFCCTETIRKKRERIREW